MLLSQIYSSLADPTRLRLLFLLSQSPLCVCHFQKILGLPQVRISKHLAYLKARGLVDARRHQNWMIYSIPQPCPPQLEANLRCLQACVQTDPDFQADLNALRELQTTESDRMPAQCCPTPNMPAAQTGCATC